MNYGLYLSASGVLTNIYRQDVFTNNMANVETAAFKPDVPAIAQRAPEAVEDPAGLEASQELLEKLGGGVLAGRQRINFDRGELIRTERDLDLALEDEGQFFNIRGTDPATGQPRQLLTRDGRLELNDAGELVMIAGGYQLLDSTGQTIKVPDNAKVTIGRDGGVFADGERVADLGVSQVSNLGARVKQGSGLFAWEGADPRRAAEGPALRRGYVEGSGVDPVRALMEVVNAAKAVSSNANMIRYHDTLLDRAVNQLGRIA
jgi:flagellar basal-body rod protein FlgG